MKSLVIVMLTSVMAASDAANIFVLVPTPSYSHQQFYRVLMLELHARGHNLTVATANPLGDRRLKNYREIDLGYGYNYLKKIFSEVSDINNVSPMTPELFFILFAKIINDMCEMILADDNLMSIYKNNEKFDLIIIEWGLYRCFHPFEKVADGKIIGIASYDIGGLSRISMGSPSNPAFVPDYSLSYTDHMSFFQRLRMTILYGSAFLLYFWGSHREQSIAEKYFGPDIPRLSDIEQRVALVFDNTHPTSNYPKPENINHIPLGGPAFHLNGWKHKKLPEDIQDFMDNAEHGVIYFSLGSNVKTSRGFRSEEKIFVKCFSRMKQRILWKWENENLSLSLNNVKLGKWFPQVEILGHPKMKAFVTQGGLQSIGEAIEYHVPMVIMPFFADQGFNAMKMTSVGVAVTYQFEDLSADGFTRALEEVIYNETYKENIIKFSNLVKDQPIPPLEKAVWWVEYVIRHNGAPHLRSVAATMPWYQYFMIDVLLAFLFVFVSFTYVVYIFLRAGARFVFRKRKTKKD